tara:strand:- start:101 stop:331 length:231 start_codon:yes stop_codon:yes gene_type:complete
VQIDILRGRLIRRLRDYGLSGDEAIGRTVANNMKNSQKILFYVTQTRRVFLQKKSIKIKKGDSHSTRQIACRSEKL